MHGCMHSCIAAMHHACAMHAWARRRHEQSSRQQRRSPSHSVPRTRRRGDGVNACAQTGSGVKTGECGAVGVCGGRGVGGWSMRWPPRVCGESKQHGAAAGSREQGAGSREQGAGSSSREQPQARVSLLERGCHVRARAPRHLGVKPSWCVLMCAACSTQPFRWKRVWDECAMTGVGLAYACM